MSGRSSSRQSLRGLTLTVLIPCLLFSAALSGWITYRDLYRVILNHGFEQKLVAVSTGVAAFIDGEVHLELSRASRMAGIAADPAQPVLWGVDDLNGRMVIVDLVTGGATGIGDLPVPGIGPLAYDVPGERLLAARSGTGELFAFVPGFSDVTEAGSVESGVFDMALDPTGTRVVAAGPWGVKAYDRTDRRLVETWATDVASRGVAIAPQTGALYVLRDDGVLLVADSVGGDLEPLGAPESEDEDGDPGQMDRIVGLTATTLTQNLFGAGSRLVGISPDDMTFEVERFRRGFRDPGGMAYRGYFEPMQRIRSALDITYLYTQNLVEGDSVQYVVDGTPGDDHSPIGAREALESDADIQGLRAVMDRSQVYSSGIEDSEDWGLLKSAYAPIVGPLGGPVGMVGTDISVSTIQDRTQIALAKVGLVTVVVLFLGGLGSVLISLRLTGPLAEVQEGASRVAAGRMGKPIAPPRLRDLADLTTSFNEMTQTLNRSVEGLREETLRVESMRARRHLAQELASRVSTEVTLPGGVAVRSADGGGDAAARARLVMVELEGRPHVLAWLKPVEGDPLSALAEREELALLARRLRDAGDAGGPAAGALLRDLERFWPVESAPLVLVDPQTGVVMASSGPAPHAALREKNGSETPAELEPHTEVEVPAGSTLVVTVGGGSPAEDAGRGDPWVLEVQGGRP